MGGEKYLLVAGGRVELVESLEELRRRLSSIEEGRVEVYKVTGVEKVLEGDARLLSKLLGAQREHVRVEVRGEGGGKVHVVLDQMFRGFAEVLEREVPSSRIEFHEVVGRGISTPVRIGRVVREPARDDYDVLKLVKRLASEGRVVLFTGDKRLAQQAAAVKGVHVEYMPPGEFGGKEEALEHMIKVIGKVASASSG